MHPRTLLLPFVSGLITFGVFAATAVISSSATSGRGLGVLATTRVRIIPALLRHASLVLSLGLASVTPPVVAATPATSATPTTSQSADLRAYLDSVQWYQRALAKLPHPDDPSNREFFAAFAANTTPDQFYAKALPVLERYLSAKDAHTLGIMARKRPVPAADQQAALESLARIDQQAKPDMEHIWGALIDAFSQHNLERAIAEVQRSIADLAAHEEPDYMPSVNKVGLSYLDKIDSLIVNLYARQWNASKVRETRCGESSPEAALAPAALLAKGGFASAHKALDDCERALQSQEASNESAFNDFMMKAQAIKVADRTSVLKQMEEASLTVNKHAQKLSELHRQLLNDQRRLVNLMEARREHVHLEDGQLAFDSDEDVAQVNRIVDDIVTHGEAINAFLYQVRQNSVLLRGVDLHDGVTAPTKPAENAQ